MFKNTVFVAAVAGLVLALAPAAPAGVVAECNIDKDNIYVPAAMKTLYEGGSVAQFRLVFVTAGTYQAQSKDIATYNGYVTAAANGVPALLALGTDWYVIGSTSTVSAKSNTYTDTGTGYPVFRLDGAVVFKDYLQLWGGGSIENTICVDPNSIFVTTTGEVNTGTDEFGDVNNWVSGPYVGGGFGSVGGWTTRGHCIGFLDHRWINNAYDRLTSAQRLYGLSGVFTVVPEPATMALLGLGGLGMLLGRRRHRV